MPTSLSAVELSLKQQNLDIENLRPETCPQNLRMLPKNARSPAAETAWRLANPRNCRAFSAKLETARKPHTDWLGRQDSNLGMAESKSDQFSCDINAHSEFLAAFWCLPIKSLGPPFRMRLQDAPRLRPRVPLCEPSPLAVGRKPVEGSRRAANVFWIGPAKLLEGVRLGSNVLRIRMLDRFRERDWAPKPSVVILERHVYEHCLAMASFNAAAHRSAESGPSGTPNRLHPEGTSSTPLISAPNGSRCPSRSSM